MTKKCIFSEKNSLDLFSLFLFLTRIFFTWFWIENIFFLMKIQFRRWSIFMTRQRKKIHSAFTQFHTNVFNFFENLLHFVFKRKLFFSPWKTKIHLVPHTEFLFLVVFLRRIFFFTFLWETQRKWEKKYSHWFFFLLSSTYFFFCYWFSQRKYNVPLCFTHRTVLSGKKEFSEKNKKNKHIFLVRNNFFLSGPHTEQKK